jgi:hypothetical protein
VGACSNPNPPCSSPSTGTFTVTLAYSRTIPVAIYCDAGAIDASPVEAAAKDSGVSDSGTEAGVADAGASCSARPHPFDGTTWTIAVTGSATTVTPKGSAAWTCTSISPTSPPGSGPDGSAVPATGCYLLVSCGRQAGAADVEVQIFAQSSTDVLVLVHDDTDGCCNDEYTGTWH